MQHTTNKGDLKIIKDCTYPLTKARCVVRIYTNLAIIDVTDDVLALRELAPNITFAYVPERTGALSTFEV